MAVCVDSGHKVKRGGTVRFEQEKLQGVVCRGRVYSLYKRVLSYSCGAG